MSEQLEARQEPRVDADFLAVIHLARERQYCPVTDLSESGVSLQLQQLSKPTTYLDLDLHVPDSLKPIRAVARRIHVRPGLWGLKFVKVSPGGKTRLARYVRKRLPAYAVEDTRSAPPLPAPEPDDPGEITKPSTAPLSLLAEPDAADASPVALTPPSTDALPTGRSRKALPVPIDAVAPSFSPPELPPLARPRRRSKKLRLHARTIVERRKAV